MRPTTAFWSALRCSRTTVAATSAATWIASYGLCNWAERTSAVRRRGDFLRLAVIGDTTAAITPCGACRQVMAELCDPQMPVLMANLRGDQTHATVATLLSESFALPLPA